MFGQMPATMWTSKAAREQDHVLQQFNTDAINCTIDKILACTRDVQYVCDVLSRLRC